MCLCACPTFDEGCGIYATWGSGGTLASCKQEFPLDVHVSDAAAVAAVAAAAEASTADTAGAAAVKWCCGTTCRGNS